MPSGDLVSSLLVTFHGMYVFGMVRWSELVCRRTAGKALARLVRASIGSAEHVPGRDAARSLL